MARWRPMADDVKSSECQPGGEWIVEETAYPFTDEDLSPQQRSWVPRDPHEIFNTWPNDWKMEIWDGAPQFLNGSDPPWDWRAVAVASRAYPECRIICTTATGWACTAVQPLENDMDAGSPEYRDGPLLAPPNSHW